MRKGGRERWLWASAECRINAVIAPSFDPWGLFLGSGEREIGSWMDRGRR